MWIAIMSFGYSAFYFGVLGYFIFAKDGASYIGVQGNSPVEVLFNFIYFSFVSITSLSSTEITPSSFLTKTIHMFEISLGIFFTLFIFSLFANQLMNRRLDED